MPKYEELIKEKDDRGPLDLTRQIGELQCENAGLKTKVHDAELETSLVKVSGYCKYCGDAIMVVG